MGPSPAPELKSNTVTFGTVGSWKNLRVFILDSRLKVKEINKGLKVV